MAKTAIFKKWFIVFLAVIACGDREPETGFLLRAVLSSKEHVVLPYYIPTFQENEFPPPRRLIRKIKEVSPAEPVEIQNGSKDVKKIALTFDACATLIPSRYDSAVAQILISTNTPATIFLGGKWVMDRPGDAKFLASVPFFELGNHSYLHGHLTRVSHARLYHELLWTQEIIYTVTDKIPVVFRPPYLENDTRVTSLAAHLGLKTICGDLPSGDPDENATKERLLDEIKRHVHNGAIIIMHINKGGKHTAEALPGIIDFLQEEGYELVTVSQLLKER
jgi:peptidoglycan/xylan/chitin deacetylase (PgdA/CDA1 family)